MTTATADSEIDIEKLVSLGDIVQCAACDEYNSYAWIHVPEKESYLRGCYKKGEIAHIGASSCFEWECGHCGANNVDPESPTLAEVYTHVSPEDRDASFS